MRWPTPSRSVSDTSMSDVALAHPRGAAGDSLIASTWTSISRATGFVRVAVTAAVLGPTYFGNTYQATNALPNIVYYGLLAGSLMSSLLVPALVAHIDGRRRAACERVAGGALGLSLLGLGVLLPVVFLVAPFLLRFAALRSVAPAIADQQAHLARLFLLLLLPQVFLYAVVACSVAVMTAHRRFALSAGAPSIENLGSIAVLVATAMVYPGTRALDEVPTGEVLLLGLGTTGAVALHAALQWNGARRAGVTLRPLPGWRDGEVVALLRRSVPALALAALEGVQLLGVLVVANRVAGGVVAYQIATNFFFLPLALGATPVALSLLPRLSRLHRRGERALLRDTAVRGLRFALFLTVPAAVALAILAPVLGAAVSFGEMVTAGGDVLVASALVALAPGVAAETALLVGTYASYSCDDTRSPLRSGLLRTGTCLALLGAATTVSGPAVLLAIGLAVSIAAIVAATHRITALLRDLPKGEERLLRPLCRTAFAAAVMAGPLLVTAHLLGGRTGQVIALTAAMGACLVSGAVYLGMQALLRAPEVGWFLGALPGARLGRSGAGLP
jgi:peptidoglycan biosynthesis protein MviN/MurJ (putative lipid II flippase)